MAKWWSCADWRVGHRRCPPASRDSVKACTPSVRSREIRSCDGIDHHSSASPLPMKCEGDIIGAIHAVPSDPIQQTKFDLENWERDGKSTFYMKKAYFTCTNRLMVMHPPFEFGCTVGVSLSILIRMSKGLRLEPVRLRGVVIRMTILSSYLCLSMCQNVLR